jgi:hypothetical protein
MKKIFFTGILLSVAQWASAETSSGVMEGNGKIFVVLATVLAIYAGLLLFLTTIERKLSGLERQIKE